MQGKGGERAARGSDPREVTVVRSSTHQRILADARSLPCSVVLTVAAVLDLESSCPRCLTLIVCGEKSRGYTMQGMLLSEYYTRFVHHLTSPPSGLSPIHKLRQAPAPEAKHPHPAPVPPASSSPTLHRPPNLASPPPEASSSSPYSNWASKRPS